MKLCLRYTTHVLTLVLFATFLVVAGTNGTTITILHVNDTHSHLDAFGPKDIHLNGTVGGIAKAAAVIGTVRATESNVLLLHAGDVFHGDFFFNKYFGVPELQLMNNLGFDAMAVGNHEFDAGPDVLLGVLQTAFPSGGCFPILSANLDMSGFPALTQWVQPSIMKEVGGVKVGIFGMTVPNDPTTNPAPVIIRDDIKVVAQQAVQDLRNAGAAVVVCLSHLGSANDKDVAVNVSGIDFIIGGHDHFLFEKPVSVTSPNGKKTLIFQAGESYMYVGKLTFSVDNGRVKVKDYRILPVDCRVRPVPEIQSVVNDLKDGIVAQYGDVYHKVVGFATHELTKAYDPDSRLRDTPLGDLITDACRKKGGTDISIAAHGLISEKIYPGIIVGADVFRAVSYGYDETTGLGFKLVKLQLAGTELVKALEGALSFLGQNDDFFLQVSGMKYRYNATKPIGARVMISSIRIGGKPFDPTATYSITVNEGIAMLLPLLDVNPTGIEPLTDFEYNVVKDYTKSLGIVCYKPEGRIVDVSVLQKEEEEIGEEAAESYDGGTAHEFRLMQNYPNPFNPTTEIRYRMSEFGFVSLKVYDVLGREVATLVDEEKPAGSYTVRFNATGLASGVYYCRLRAGSFVETRKMAMMK